MSHHTATLTVDRAPIDTLPTESPTAATPATTSAPAHRPSAVVRLVVAVACALTSWQGRLARRATTGRGTTRSDRGQATTEYALVLLAAALVALLVIAWATAGGGGARIARLFNRVIDAVIDRV